MNRARIEWPTLGLLAVCYAGWLAAVWLAGAVDAWLIVLAAPFVALHGSLQHEALHGHPTRNPRLNETLVSPPLGLVFPYRRFKSLHLRHHNNDALTDPYDDPESFYLAMGDWKKLPSPVRRLLAVNNTLAGRLVLGPAISAFGFAGAEARLVLAGDRAARRAWLLHALGIAGLAAVLWSLGVPFWLYAVGAAYPGLSLLMLRTFAEHQASETPGARTAIVEAAAPFALLFLNNNLHFVHHEHPRMPWYELPRFYRAEREAFRAANGAYTFRGYGEIARRYAFRARGPVAHPYLRTDAGESVSSAPSRSRRTAPLFPRRASGRPAQPLRPGPAVPSAATMVGEGAGLAAAAP